MDIKGKIQIFPAQAKVFSDGTEYRPVRASISSKVNNEYISYSLDIKFNSEVFPNEKLMQLDPNKTYQLEVEEGWLGVSQYKYQDEFKKKLYIFVNRGHLVAGSAKEIKRQDEDLTDIDLPF